MSFTIPIQYDSDLASAAEKQASAAFNKIADNAMRQGQRASEGIGQAFGSVAQEVKEANAKMKAGMAGAFSGMSEAAREEARAAKLAMKDAGIADNVFGQIINQEKMIAQMKGVRIYVGDLAKEYTRLTRTVKEYDQSVADGVLAAKKSRVEQEAMNAALLKSFTARKTAEAALEQYSAEEERATVLAKENLRIAKAKDTALLKQEKSLELATVQAREFNSELHRQQIVEEESVNVTKRLNKEFATLGIRTAENQRLTEMYTSDQYEAYEVTRLTAEAQKKLAQQRAKGTEKVRTLRVELEKLVAEQKKSNAAAAAAPAKIVGDAGTKLGSSAPVAGSAAELAAITKQRNELEKLTATVSTYDAALAKQAAKQKAQLAIWEAQANAISRQVVASEKATIANRSFNETLFKNAAAQKASLEVKEKLATADIEQAKNLKLSENALDRFNAKLYEQQQVNEQALLSKQKMAQARAESVALLKTEKDQIALLNSAITAEAAKVRDIIALKEREVAARAAISKEVSEQRVATGMAESLSKQTKAAEAAKVAYASFNKELHKTKIQNELLLKSSQALAAAEAKQSAELRDLETQYGRLTDKMQVEIEKKKLLNKLAKDEAVLRAKNSKEVREQSAQLDKLSNSYAKAEGWAKRLQAAMAGTGKSILSTRSHMQGLGSGMNAFTSGNILAVSALYSLIAALRDTVRAGVEFSGEMARVGAIMGATDEEMEKLSATALNLAADSQFLGTEVAKALEELGMAGLSASEAMVAIAPTLSLAAIGAMDFGTAADIATNVMTGFGKEAYDLTNIVDIMATAITGSNQTVEQLGNSLSYTAPIASAFGVSIESATASIEVLANSGIKASRAGTGLRRVMLNMFEPTKKGAAAFKELGVSVNMMAEDMDQEFIRVLDALNVATEDATTNVSKLTDIVGVRASAAFIQLVKSMNDSDKGFHQFRDQLASVEGAAKSMQEAVEDSLAVDWKKFLSAVEALQINVFAEFEEDIRSFVQYWTEVIQRMANDKEVIIAIKDWILQLAESVKQFVAILLVAKGIQFSAGIVASFAEIGSASSKAGVAVGIFGKLLKAIPFVAAIALIWDLVEGFGEITDATMDLNDETEEYFKLLDKIDAIGGATGTNARSTEIAKQAAAYKDTTLELEEQLKHLEREIQFLEAMPNPTQAVTDKISAMKAEIIAVGQSLQVVLSLLGQASAAIVQTEIEAMDLEINALQASMTNMAKASAKATEASNGASAAGAAHAQIMAQQTAAMNRAIERRHEYVRQQGELGKLAVAEIKTNKLYTGSQRKVNELMEEEARLTADTTASIKKDALSRADRLDIIRQELKEFEDFKDIVAAGSHDMDATDQADFVAGMKQKQELLQQEAELVKEINDERERGSGGGGGGGGGGGRANQIDEETKAVSALVKVTGEYASELQDLNVLAEDVAELSDMREGALKEVYAITESLNGQTTISIAQSNKLAAAEDKLKAITDAYTKSKEKLIERNEEAIKLGKSEQILYDRTAKELRELRNEYFASYSGLEDYRLKQANLNDLLEKGVITLGDYNKGLKEARLEYQRTQGPLQEYAASLEESMGSLEGIAVDAMDEFKDTIVDALVDGEASFDDFVDSVKKKLLEIAINKIYVSIIGNVSTTGSVVGAAASAVTGGAADSAGGSGGIGGLSSITKAFGGNSIGETLGSGLKSLNSTLNLGLDSLADTAAANLAATSNLTLAAGSIAGSLLGSALFGDKGYGSIGSSVGSTAGSVLGSALIPIPVVGTLLGGLLGGVGGGFLGSLFGGENEPDPKTIVELTEGRFSLKWSQDLEEEQIAAIEDAMSQLNSVLDTMAETLGEEATEALKGVNFEQALEADLTGDWLQKIFTDNIRLMASSIGDGVGDVLVYMLDIVEDDVEAFVNDLSAIMPAAASLKDTAMGDLFGVVHDELRDNMLTLIDLAQEFAKEEETMGETISRMVTSTSILSSAIALTGGTMDEMALVHIVRLGEALIDLAESSEDLTSKMSFYYENFFSDAERQAAQVAAANDLIARGMEDLGVVIPTTREQFRNLVEGIDLGTESGRKLFIELMDLAAAFDVVFDAGEKVGEVSTDVADFIASLKPESIQTSDDLSAMQALFATWGLTLPMTSEALYDLIQAGALTEEQIRRLVDNADALTRAWDHLEKTLGDSLRTLSADRIAALEADSEARIKAIEAEGEAQIAALNARKDALNDQLSELKSSLSSFDSIIKAVNNALDSLDNQTLGIDELRQKRLKEATDAIAKIRAGGAAPDNINQIISDLSSVDANDFATREEWLKAIEENEKRLAELREAAGGAKSDAEKQIELLEAQIDAIDAQIEAVNAQTDALIEAEEDNLEKLIAAEEEALENILDSLDQFRFDSSPEALAAALAAEVDRLIKGITDGWKVPPVPETPPPEKWGLGAQLLGAQLTPQERAKKQRDERPTFRGGDQANDDMRTDGEERLTTTVANLEFELSLIREKLLEGNTTNVAVHKIIKRWDGEGLPADRDDYAKTVAESVQ